MSVLQHAMKFTANYRARAGITAHGDPTWGSWTPFKCRYQEGREVDRFKGTRGNELRLETIILTYDVVPQGAQIALPGDATTDTQLVRKALQVTHSPSSIDSRTLYKVRLSNQETI